MSRFGVAVLAMIMVLAVPAYGKELVVDCDDDPSALTAAIASASAGATLRVEGRCLGPILIETDLTIEGAHAIIDGDGAGPVITVGTGVAAVLEDVEITGGAGRGSLAVGGIHNQGGDVTLTEVRVSGNGAEATGVGAFPEMPWLYNLSVGGIYNDPRSTLTLVDSTVADNDARSMADTDEGWRIALAIGGVSTWGNATVSDSIVSDNRATATSSAAAVNVTASASGGVYSHNPSTSLTMDDSTVRNNVASASAQAYQYAEAGGGITNFDGPLALTDVTVSENAADADSSWEGVALAGIAAQYTNFYGSPVTITDCEVSNNHATGDYAIGGINAFYSDVTVQDTTVRANRAEANLFAAGGVLNGPWPGMLTLIDGRVIENVAAPALWAAVGGVSSHADYVSISGTEITKNLPIDCDFDPACRT